MSTTALLTPSNKSSCVGVWISILINISASVCIFTCVCVCVCVCIDIDIDIDNRRTKRTSKILPRRCVLWLLLLLVASMETSGCKASTSSSSAMAIRPSNVVINAHEDAHTIPNTNSVNENENENENENNNNNNNEDIRLVFSDVDGTLVHYPSDFPESDTKPETESDTHRRGSSKDNDNDNDNDTKKKLLALPPSSTGLRGIISTRTLELAREIRRTNTKLVVVSGMRTSTLLQRLPYLPKADAYCSENGGRIFRLLQDEDGDETDDVIWVRPQKYFADNHDSNSSDDDDDDDDNNDPFRPFRIREDPEWKRIMASALSGTEQEPAGPAPPGDFSSAPLVEREGPLWDFVRHLSEAHGVVPDCKGYSTCVRVRQKQQTLEAWKRLSPEAFCERLRGLLREHEAKLKREHEHPSISCSVNLGCVDFYPSASGKKGCALYLAGEWFGNGNDNDDDDDNGNGNDDDDDDDDDIDTKHYGGVESNTKTSAPENFSARLCRNHAVLLCDDDNDLELAAACSRAYLPGAASPVIARLAETDPERYVPAFSRNCKDTDASDRALEWILEAVTKQRNE